jgi:hypothetical protein
LVLKPSFSVHGLLHSQKISVRCSCY